MTTSITLDRKQIIQLMTGKSVKIETGKYVELLNDDIMININGLGYFADKIDIKYNEKYDCGEGVIEHFQELICEHFNIGPYGAVYSGGNHPEFTFIIRFGRNGLRELLITDYKNAIDNIRQIRDDYNFNADITEPYIGLYRKLNNSPYYFRWLDETI